MLDSNEIIQVSVEFNFEFHKYTITRINATFFFTDQMGRDDKL